MPKTLDDIHINVEHSLKFAKETFKYFKAGMKDIRIRDFSSLKQLCLLEDLEWVINDLESMNQASYSELSQMRQAFAKWAQTRQNNIQGTDCDLLINPNTLSNRLVLLVYHALYGRASFNCYWQIFAPNVHTVIYAEEPGKLKTRTTEGEDQPPDSPEDYLVMQGIAFHLPSMTRFPDFDSAVVIYKHLEQHYPHLLKLLLDQTNTVGQLYQNLQSYIYGRTPRQALQALDDAFATGLRDNEVTEIEVGQSAYQGVIEFFDWLNNLPQEKKESLLSLEVKFGFKNISLSEVLYEFYEVDRVRCVMSLKNELQRFIILPKEHPILDQIRVSNHSSNQTFINRMNQLKNECNQMASSEITLQYHRLPFLLIQKALQRIPDQDPKELINALGNSGIHQLDVYKAIINGQIKIKFDSDVLKQVLKKLDIEGRSQLLKRIKHELPEVFEDIENIDDLRRILKLCTLEQAEIVFEAVKDKWVEIGKNCDSQDVKQLLKSVNADLRTQLLIRFDISEFIEDIDYLRDILKKCTPEQEKIVLEAVKDKWVEISKNSDSKGMKQLLKTVNVDLGTQLLIRFDISEFIKGIDDLRRILKLCTPQQEQIVLEAVKDKWVEISKNCDSQDVKQLLKTVNADLGTQLLLRLDIPEFIEDIDDLRDILKKCTPEQEKIVLEAVKDKWYDNKSMKYMKTLLAYYLPQIGYRVSSAEAFYKQFEHHYRNLNNYKPRRSSIFEPMSDPVLDILHSKDVSAEEKCVKILTKNFKWPYLNLKQQALNAMQLPNVAQARNDDTMRPVYEKPDDTEYQTSFQL